MTIVSSHDDLQTAASALVSSAKRVPISGHATCVLTRIALGPDGEPGPMKGRPRPRTT